MTDYERGVEQASNVYQEVIHEYVNENAKLRKFATRLLRQSLEHTSNVITRDILTDEARELGVEVDA